MSCWVAPFTGAWIEISGFIDRGRHHRVAPFTGAWIEMYIDIVAIINAHRRSLHGSVD